MFRPTQTVPSALTALTIVLGFLLAVGFIVIAMIGNADTGLTLELRSRVSQNSGLLFVTAILAFVAAIRPLAGGLSLLVMAVLILTRLPITAGISVAFGLLCLLRAYMSRRYLAREAESQG